MNDDDIRDRLRDLDDSEDDISDWEAEFLESVVFEYEGPLSDRQRTCAIDILNDYGF